MRSDTLDRADLCEFCDGPAEWELTLNDGSVVQACRDCAKLDDFAGIVTRTAARLMRDINQDPAAVARMMERQARERMSAFAVLSHFGDPRTWEESC